MKATLNNPATYESPRTEVLNIAPEGVLCGSSQEYKFGGDLLDSSDDWTN